MAALTETILNEAQKLPEGTPLAARELLHLGSRAAVDQALSRLTRQNELMRAERGLYLLPVQTRFGRRAPSAEKVLSRIAELHAETIAPHGAAAANKLGLTTQVPTKVVYYTSGPSRRIRLGAQTVVMKHAPNWVLRPGPGRAGEIIRALLWIGPRHVDEALSKLRQALPKQELNELVKLRGALPTWLSKSISRGLVPRG